MMNKEREGELLIYKDEEPTVIFFGRRRKRSQRSYFLESCVSDRWKIN